MAAAVAGGWKLFVLQFDCNVEEINHIGLRRKFRRFGPMAPIRIIRKDARTERISIRYYYKTSARRALNSKEIFQEFGTLYTTTEPTTKRWRWRNHKVAKEKTNGDVEEEGYKFVITTNLTKREIFDKLLDANDDLEIHSIIETPGQNISLVLRTLSFAVYNRYLKMNGVFLNGTMVLVKCYNDLIRIGVQLIAEKAPNNTSYESNNYLPTFRKTYSAPFEKYS